MFLGNNDISVQNFSNSYHTQVNYYSNHHSNHTYPIRKSVPSVAAVRDRRAEKNDMEYRVINNCRRDYICLTVGPRVSNLE